ncbi:beta-L-arabinofuranosidase domain-containing protein [Actinopolymorpha sp. B11F2]|uniref:glycoside hydrolase family 127 protein n=1 Tax=Actinopolymorpha sp. B11F2 TaxID=3160862 RepID=UPI0032E45F4B
MSTPTTPSRTQLGGPVLPTSDARVPHRPVADVTVDGGLWQHWQTVNRTASIPTGVAKLEEFGNLANLRLAAGEDLADEHRGPVYVDSDVHKLLESAAWELRHAPDPGLADFVDAATGLLERAQEKDGYVNSYYQVRPGQRYTRMENSHELYTAGHLLQAAVAVHRVLGDDRLLGVARRLADHLVREFLREGELRLDGHPGAETALVELFRDTGDRDYLELAAALVEGRGRGRVGRSTRGSAYFQDHAPAREMRSLVGHAVRALYFEAGIVDVAVETGDGTLLRTSIARWDDMVSTRTALTGGLGARQLAEAFGERYEQPPDQAYNETCAAVASIHWSWRLLLATREGKFADLIERTLYNAFAASISIDGREYFKGNPLQRRPDHAEAIGDPRYRDGWFWSACCPPNVTRLMATLEDYAATATADTVYLHQFATSTLRQPLASGVVELAVVTDYPWDGTVHVTVRECPAASWTLAVRIPPWSGRTLMNDGDGERQVARDAQGYVTIRRDWREGDVVTLRFDMTPRLTFPHPRLDAVRGCVAIERGPLVYCLEQVDQRGDVPVDDVALSTESRLRVVDTPHRAGIGRTVVIEADAVQLTPPPAGGFPYYAGGPYAGNPATSRAVPVVAVPYFQWANRGTDAMRVWIPLAG